MVEIKNDTQLKVGDKVYWIDQWKEQKWGIIYDIQPCENGELFACIQENGLISRINGTSLKNCWLTKENCLAAEEKRSRLQIEEYKDAIKDKDDLVRFMFKHKISGTHWNKDVETAARQRAIELGITLDN